MYESLPESEQEIRNEAQKRDMITSTNNCVVSVLVHDGNEKTKFVKVQEVQELDSLDAVKKNKQLTATASKKYRHKTNATALVESRGTNTNLMLNSTFLFSVNFRFFSVQK